MNCKNCNTEINSNFCTDCGQPTNLKRIDRKYIIHEIEHVLHFERGILYTVRELVTNQLLTGITTDFRRPLGLQSRVIIPYNGTLKCFRVLLFRCYLLINLYISNWYLVCCLEKLCIFEIR
jgi:hypothetical protein